MSKSERPKTTLTIILAAALSLSELLAIVPGIKSNSLFQLFSSLMESVAHLADQPEPVASPTPPQKVEVQIKK